jgi:putative PIN family toxin of toxin-antitoxin system
MKTGKPLKLILDTNVLISAIIGKFAKHQFDELLDYYKIGLISFCICQTLVDEFLDVASRPKIVKYVPFSNAERFISLYQKISINYKSKNLIWFEPDPKDSYLLSLAAKAEANYLVCGDKALLQLGKTGKTSIITLNELLNILKAIV